MPERVFYIREIFFELGCASAVQPHPNLENVYWDKVADLICILNDPSTIVEASEALRGYLKRTALQRNQLPEARLRNGGTTLVHDKRKSPDASHRSSTTQAPPK